MSASLQLLMFTGLLGRALLIRIHLRKWTTLEILIVPGVGILDAEHTVGRRPLNTHGLLSRTVQARIECHGVPLSQDFRYYT